MSVMFTSAWPLAPEQHRKPMVGLFSSGACPCPLAQREVSSPLGPTPPRTETNPPLVPRPHALSVHSLTSPCRSRTPNELVHATRCPTREPPGAGAQVAAL